MARIVFVVLVEEDVASVKGGLVQIIYELFLLNGQGFESGNLVPHHAYVVETVCNPFEIIVFALRARAESEQ